MRALFAAAVIVLSLHAAVAAPWVRSRPPRPIDAPTFACLLDALAREHFTDDKLARIRAIAPVGSFVFDATQTIAVLERFSFWLDRAEALRLLPLVDRPNAVAVLDYFAPAPELTRSEAQRI